MSQTELEEDCLLAEYNGYFDDMILVGHMEEEFICHADGDVALKNPTCFISARSACGGL